MLLLVTLSPMADAAEPVTKKQAQQWVSFTMTCKKQLLAAAKKAKSEKDGANYRDAVNRVYNQANAYPGVSPMGACALPAAPSGPECDEAFEKKDKQISSLDSALEKELQRIKEANFRSEYMLEGLVKTKLIMGLMEP